MKTPSEQFVALEAKKWLEDYKEEANRFQNSRFFKDWQAEELQWERHEMTSENNVDWDFGAPVGFEQGPPEQEEYDKIQLSENGVVEILERFQDRLSNNINFTRAVIVSSRFIGKKIAHSKFIVTIEIDWEIFTIEYEVPLLVIRNDYDSAYVSSAIDELYDVAVKDMMVALIEYM